MSSYYGITSFQGFSSNIKGNSLDMYDILAASGEHSKVRAIKSTVNILKSNMLSATSSEGKELLQEKLDIINNGFKNTVNQASNINLDEVIPQKSYTVTSAAKEAAKEMLASVTGSGTKLDLTV